MICYRQAQKTQLINFAHSGVDIYFMHGACHYVNWQQQWQQKQQML